MNLTLFCRARDCAKMVEDLATSGKQFHVRAIINKEMLYMTRLLNGGCTTFKPLGRKLYLVYRGVYI